MNFNWEKTTKEDIDTFNKWHTYAIKNANEKKDGISKFLVVDREHLLGDAVMIFVDDLNDENSYSKCVTAKVDNVPVGMVLYSIFNSKISRGKVMLHVEMIATNPKLQGKGIGTAMIFDIVKNKEAIFGRHIDLVSASVHKDNIPSQKAFSNNNFAPYKNTATLDDYRLDVSGIKPDENAVSFKKDLAQLLLQIKTDSFEK